MQLIDETFLSLGVDEGSQISDNQLTLLDIDLKQKDTWYEISLGKTISDARAELFVLLKGISTKSNQDKIIKNYKALQKFRKESLESKETQTQETHDNSDEVVIYCDGGCSPNPGEAGSGISIYRDGKIAELWYGLYEEMGTNNTAELNALYNSLLIAKKESQNAKRVEVKCDSMYAINCISTWAISWEKNGWKKKGREIKNLEIIQTTYKLYNEIKNKITLSHIKAHNGTEGNELADRMTIYTREQKQKELVKYSHKIDVSKILKIRSS